MSNSALPAWYSQTIARLTARQDLSSELVEAMLGDLLTGACEPIHATAALTAWRCKGESADELATAARLLRQHMQPLCGAEAALDTCGTGGDTRGTFNISTATALVVAACGVPVVKHGNRAVSSRSGSSDVLRELGIGAEQGADWSMRAFAEVGCTFCHAPHFHPALASIAPLRRMLGFRTAFNLLGPLLNPAGAAYQLIGVGSPEMLVPMAGAIAQLGVRRALVVHGRDGLDEVSLSGPTDVRIVQDGQVESCVWESADFGLAGCDLSELHAESPAVSAAMILGVFDNRDGAPTRIVLANAAAGLFVTGRVRDLRAGVAVAQSAIERGDARRLLERLQAISRP